MIRKKTRKAMKVSANAIEDLLSSLRQYFQKDNFNREDVNARPPLRSELFTLEQMEQHARHLAASHPITKDQAQELLLNRLSDNEEVLGRVTALLQDAVREKKAITPAGEWLLDNYYLIEDQTRAAKKYLPKGYSKGLPRLSSGSMAGYPRVYDIAIEIISHSDGHVDIHSLSGFVAAYQQVKHLTLGELWAIPIMLQLALLENLRRVATRIAVDRIDTTVANNWADKIVDTVEKDPRDLVLVIADMARSKPPMVSAFVAEFARRLQWKGHDFTFPLTWLEQHLSGTGQTINSMVLMENQQQASDQLSVSNCINSLRFLAKMDWREFVETISLVEQTLRKDEMYGRMDFHTRDQYRHQVEKIAKQSERSEAEVAQVAIDLATQSSVENPEDKRRAHVGYYLIDSGKKQTEEVAGVQWTAGTKALRFLLNTRRFWYFAGVFIITALMTFSLAERAYLLSSSAWLVALAAVVGIITGSQLALALTNWLGTILVKPKSLPKLDFSTGIPSEARTMVVVPTLIADKVQAASLVNDLEVRFLANRDPHLVFALLTDFPDAAYEENTSDLDVLSFVKERITDLNERYSDKTNGTFMLFHRPRLYNEAEKKWMGYERKRGKIAELNKTLRGIGKQKFSVIIGDERIYTNVKYVITLDTDTQLPRDAAWKLAGVMEHPLNTPHYDQQKKRVTEGYAIIQPRIAISLHGAVRSPYTRLNETDAGIDPYTRVTSDIYQDIFQDGSYIGKGIYQVDTFEQALDNRFPENRVLSHDLLEGSYARCGYASDIQLYEEYPAKYTTDAGRRHRWIRGDWQIATWFMPIVPNENGRLSRNPLSGTSKWKIFENLRRSLSPVAMMTLLVLGWVVFPDHWYWTLMALTVHFLPAVLISAWSALQKPDELEIRQHLSNAIGSTQKTIVHSLFSLMCLPYEAYLSVDAIVRTLWRTYITRRHLLEWNPSGFSSRKNESIGDVLSRMIMAPLSAVIIFGVLYWYNPTAILLSVPFLAAWLISPIVCWIISQPAIARKPKLTGNQILTLRELARKTWSFFENMVTAEENWLPPDNLQQYPIPVIAHRTSPTNIGMYLLSSLSAHDFGFTTGSKFVERVKLTLGTMGKMERFAGHLYNWYDTTTLQTLHPRYISTVDSGNMAAHLLVLRQGLFALRDEVFPNRSITNGLHDSLRVTLKVISKDELKLFKTTLKVLEDHMASDPLTLRSTHSFLINLLEIYRSDVVPESFSKLTEAGWWIHSFEQQVIDWIEELQFMAPWLRPGFDESTELIKVPDQISLQQLATFGREAGIAGNPAYDDFIDAIRSGSEAAESRLHEIDQLAAQCEAFATKEYGFLYDKTQRLLSIGYSVDEHRLDSSFYDLLASEARLSSFVAIAQGKLPQETWFALGRRLTSTGDTSVLLSWSGSMFEYLMPLLVMPTYENTLLDETCRGCVQKQVEYGEQQDVPWGISESCYNVVDNNLTYQYRAFGVPGMGFKRGLAQDLVIAPYASVMALMVDPEAAMQNLERLSDEGYEGRYGYYESIDFTPARLSRGQSKALIQTFMAHHQGMSMLSLAYLLLNRPMQKRFEADVQFQTALLLLQEQVPRTSGFFMAAADANGAARTLVEEETRVITTPHTPVPELQLLSNGRYHVMVTNTGGGYSKWKDLDVTRWREDTTLDNWGTYVYLRDVTTNKLWSASFQPTQKESKNYQAIFSQGRVEFRRRDHGIESYMEVIVSPEDDVEVRRVHITNHTREARQIEVTSYAEVVLSVSAADASHPAFSKLFVQTEIHKPQHTIICTRRKRSKDEQPPWMFHLMKAEGVAVNKVSYETDRNQFIGRGNSLATPIALSGNKDLSGSQGPVLDPIVSIQYRITVPPGEMVIVDLISGAAAMREELQVLIDKYQDRHLRDRAFELSRTHSQVVLRQIGATEGEAQLFGRLAGSVLYNNPQLRANPGIIQRNQRGQSALWSYSISGDLPIVILQVSDSNNIGLVKQMMKAQAYWQLKGLAVDLVIFTEDSSGYRQVLLDQIQGLIAAGIGVHNPDKKGRIFVRPLEQVPNEDVILIQSVARAIIADSKGPLFDQVNKRLPVKAVHPPAAAARTYVAIDDKVTLPADLQFFNGTGGFSADGKEYVIHTSANKPTPLPWINVIANRKFGTIISESGSSYTWLENAHEYRLTPWHNDPVSGSGGETFYIIDNDRGAFWSPSPWAATGQQPYITRHGFGYTMFEHLEDGIHTMMTVFVDVEDSIKFTSIKVTNKSNRRRKLSVGGYVEWVLGALRSGTTLHVVTEIDQQSGAVLARNAYNTEFHSRISFFDCDDSRSQFTADRAEFIGRNKSLQNPDGLKQKLSGQTGAALDPCAAFIVPFELEPGTEREVNFRLGAGIDMMQARDLIKKHRSIKASGEALKKVKSFWERTLTAVQVDTPDKALNIMANGWLQYQVMACRLWGRSGFYQSGGAFGFRDQLQDTLALLHAEPHLTRSQILIAASRQFREGDVQHWWHPPYGRGVRTMCSDDFLWLPYVASRYVTLTGDDQLLNEPVSFLQGRLLNANEESYYDLPNTSDERSSVYEHCKRAITYGFRFGEHQLPLIGSGDWNDGMNLVGIHGKGESVWLAFFLYDVLMKFLPIARDRQDLAFVKICEDRAEQLKQNIAKHAWDGHWYLRGFFDNGETLGSSKNTECRIDSISQSWSVISDGGDPERSQAGMNAANQHLVRRKKKIIQLLDPPFDKGDTDPGYIKGYLPGVRENGGQYTHAAIWTVMAFAKLKDRERTMELLKMITPVHHGDSEESIALYKAEPYVMAADIYGADPHAGRGGWTWYTGSAGWMYQLILESFLGLRRKGNQLWFEPVVPEGWNQFKVQYRFEDTLYEIEVIQDEDTAGIQVDGQETENNFITLVNDNINHVVKLRVPSHAMAQQRAH